MSTAKRGNNLHKASSILPVVAFLLTIALFVRMETVVHEKNIEMFGNMIHMSGH